VASKPSLLIFARRYQQAEENDDKMTMKFLLQNDKKKNRKCSPQKQECGYPSLQPSLCSHTHAFFANPPLIN
jgi:hypothetical protein